MWVRSAVVAEVVVVKFVTVVHILSTNVLLLCLGHRGFLVHAAAELISSVSLGSVAN